MLLSLEFPFVDTRSFLEEDSGQLKVPNWPGAIVNAEFVRSFGIVRKRPRGGLSGWIGESPICEAPRALRFENRPIVRDSSSQLDVNFYVPYRRLYFNGLAAGKFTVGLASRDVLDSTFPRRVVRELFHRVLRLPVTVPSPIGHFVHTSLAAAGKNIVELYARSSVRFAYAPKQESWWVRPITPILFLMRLRDEAFIIPFAGQQISGAWDSDLSLSQHTLSHDGVDLPLWVITTELDYAAMENARE